MNTPPRTPVTLITGGAGFLGSHLCDRLLAEGHRVVAMDNLLTGNLDNIAHLRSRTDFEFIHHNITTHIAFPGPFIAILRLLGSLPKGLQLALGKRLSRTESHS